MGNIIPSNCFMQPLNFSIPQQLIKVKGIESARMYPMQAMSTVALFDEDDDIVYIKSTDASNYPSIRVFRLTEIVEKPNQNDMSNYVTIQEFEKFKEEILNAKQSIQQPTANGKSKYPGSKQSNDGAYGNETNG